MTIGRFEVSVRSLVYEPRNVVEFKHTDLARGADAELTVCVLLSPREARRLAEMLLDVADQADALPTVQVNQ
jgi:hypothetical protein